MAAQGPCGFDMFPSSVREHNVQSQLDKMAKQLEDLKFKQVHQSQTSFTEQIKQAIGYIRTQLTQLSVAVGQVQQKKGRFPSQPQVNVAGIHFVVYSSGPSNLNPRLEEANAITTLKSRKVIDKDLPPKQKSVPPPMLVVAQAVVPDLGNVPEEEKEAESLKMVRDVLEIAKKASFLDSPKLGSLIEVLAVEDVCGAAWDPILESLGAPLSTALPSSVQKVVLVEVLINPLEVLVDPG
ncbi:hypothetical protein RHMOL_Rhmol01G0237800 [Rhododendron molle]|uniref:Uncharacterized protein n=1 Tax=Rhododendron molle TaxID=49168 RepID=A0ACC0Q665_RHOML|nr:hypothetical protein RHMOL_Rhmol01G0237800 [Rhododendron molle]